MPRPTAKQKYVRRSPRKHISSNKKAKTLTITKKKLKNDIIKSTKNNNNQPSTATDAQSSPKIVEASTKNNATNNNLATEHHTKKMPDPNFTESLPAPLVAIPQKKKASNVSIITKENLRSVDSANIKVRPVLPKNIGPLTSPTNPTAGFKSMPLIEFSVKNPPPLLPLNKFKTIQIVQNGTVNPLQFKSILASGISNKIKLIPINSSQLANMQINTIIQPCLKPPQLTKKQINTIIQNVPSSKPPHLTNKLLKTSVPNRTSLNSSQLENKQTSTIIQNKPTINSPPLTSKQINTTIQNKSSINTPQLTNKQLNTPKPPLNSPQITNMQTDTTKQNKPAPKKNQPVTTQENVSIRSPVSLILPSKKRIKYQKKPEEKTTDSTEKRNITNFVFTYIAEGLAEDCENLIDNCLKVYKLTFEKFCEIWKEMNFVCIFHERNSSAELAELSEEAIFLAKRYMVSQNTNFEVKVAGLFLVYALLNLQPYEHFAALRLIPDDVPAIKALEVEARKQRRHDVLYILGHVLIKGPCQFHVAAKEVGLDSSIKKYFDGSVYTSETGTGVLKRTDETVQILKELGPLEERLKALKKKIEQRNLTKNLYLAQHISADLFQELTDLIPSTGGIRKPNTEKPSTSAEDNKAPEPEPESSRQNLMMSIKQRAMANVVEPMRHLTGIEERQHDKSLTPPGEASENSADESMSKKSLLKGKGKGKGKSNHRSAKALNDLFSDVTEEIPENITRTRHIKTARPRDLPMLDLTDELDNENTGSVAEMPNKIPTNTFVSGEPIVFESSSTVINPIDSTTANKSFGAVKTSNDSPIDEDSLVSTRKPKDISSNHETRDALKKEDDNLTVHKSRGALKKLKDIPTIKELHGSTKKLNVSPIVNDRRSSPRKSQISPNVKRSRDSLEKSIDSPTVNDRRGSPRKSNESPTVKNLGGELKESHDSAQNIKIDESPRTGESNPRKRGRPRKFPISSPQTKDNDSKKVAENVDRNLTNRRLRSFGKPGSDADDDSIIVAESDHANEDEPNDIKDVIIQFDNKCKDPSTPTTPPSTTQTHGSNLKLGAIATMQNVCKNLDIEIIDPYEADKKATENQSSSVTKTAENETSLANNTKTITATCKAKDKTVEKTKEKDEKEVIKSNTVLMKRIYPSRRKLVNEEDTLAVAKKAGLVTVESLVPKDLGTKNSPVVSKRGTKNSPVLPKQADHSKTDNESKETVTTKSPTASKEKSNKNSPSKSKQTESIKSPSNRRKTIKNNAIDEDSEATSKKILDFDESPAVSKELDAKNSSALSKQADTKKCPRATKQTNKSPVKSNEGNKNSLEKNIGSNKSEDEHTESMVDKSWPKVDKIADRQTQVKKKAKKRTRIQSRFKRLGILKVANFDDDI